jgi:hypothetical protein
MKNLLTMLGAVAVGAMLPMSVNADISWTGAAT